MLSKAINSSIKTIIVDNPNLFCPYPQYVIKIESEKMLVTAISGNRLQVNRAYAGTSAATHAAGKQVSIIVSNVMPAEYIQNVNQ